MGRSKVILIIVPLLAGCATAPPPLDVKIQCLPMVTYSAADQKALASELPHDGPGAQRFMMDYLAMRTANRACLAGK